MEPSWSRLGTVLGPSWALCGPIRAYAGLSRLIAAAWLQTVERFATLAAGAPSLVELVRDAESYMQSVVGAQSCRVWLRTTDDGVADEIGVLEAPSECGRCVSEKMGILAKVAHHRSGAAVVLPITDEDDGGASVMADGGASVMADGGASVMADAPPSMLLPLLPGDGAASLGVVECIGTFGRREVIVAEAVAPLLAMAVQRARRTDEVSAP